MLNPTQQELKDSIEDLVNYRDRLKKEVILISKKLRIPSHKINSILEEHKELNQIGIIISSLSKQKSKGSKT